MIDCHYNNKDNGLQLYEDIIEIKCTVNNSVLSSKNQGGATLFQYFIVNNKS